MLRKYHQILHHPSIRRPCSPFLNDRGVDSPEVMIGTFLASVYGSCLVTMQTWNY